MINWIIKLLGGYTSEEYITVLKERKESIETALELSNKLTDSLKNRLNVNENTYTMWSHGVVIYEDEL
jgi:hypothetical protein